MALFMDAHTIEGGVAVSDVAAAHQADVATQGAYGVDYLRYGWTRRRARSSASSRPRTPRPPPPGMRELTVRAMLHDAASGVAGDAEAAALLAGDIDNPQLAPLVAAAGVG